MNGVRDVAACLAACAHCTSPLALRDEPLQELFVFDAALGVQRLKQHAQLFYVLLHVDLVVEHASAAVGSAEGHVALVVARVEVDPVSVVALLTELRLHHAVAAARS